MDKQLASTPWDGLITGVHLATLAGDRGYGEIENGALGWQDGTLCFVGRQADLPGEPAQLARDYVARAITRLEALPASEYRDALVELSEFAVARTH